MQHYGTPFPPKVTSHICDGILIFIEDIFKKINFYYQKIDFVIDHKIDCEIDFQIDYEIDSNATSGSFGQLPVTPIGGNKNVYGNIWHYHACGANNHNAAQVDLCILLTSVETLQSQLLL